MKTVVSKKLLLSLLREIVSAQHTVYHTASIYEDDIDEMSAGGVTGAAPYRDLDEDEEDVIEIVKHCKKVTRNLASHGVCIHTKVSYWVDIDLHKMHMVKSAL